MSLLAEPQPGRAGAVIVSRWGDVLSTDLDAPNEVEGLSEAFASCLWSISSIACVVSYMEGARVFAVMQCLNPNCPKVVKA